MTHRSTADSAFLQDVQQQFADQLPVLVVVRHAYGAGSKEFVLLNSFDQFTELLNRLKQRDSVIVMRSHVVVSKGTVDSKFIDDSLSSYKQRACWILIGPDSYEYTADWAWAESLSELKEELEDRIGNFVCIIDDPDYCSENDTIAAYIPDADGTVRPGAH